VVIVKSQASMFRSRNEACMAEDHGQTTILNNEGDLSELLRLKRCQVETAAPVVD